MRTHKARVAGGREVEYLYLAHNIRNPETKKSVPKIVHAFGRADEVDREELARLCRSIARVCGLEVYDPMKEGRRAASGRALPEGVTQVETWPLGPVWVMEALWERFGIAEELRRIEGESKCTVPYERAIFSKVSDLLNVEVDVVFYDTTTCSFTVDEEDDEDGQRHVGHSKEGGWSAQVEVALAVTREGLPVRSWIFPGDVSDVDTVETVKKDLRGWKLGRALFVADSGMNSEDNRTELARACGTYLLACRAGSLKEVHEEVLGRPGRYKVIADNLHVKEVVVGKGVKRRRYLVCHNPSEAERQAKHREQVLKEIDENLASHQGDRATAKWAIELLASKRWGRYLRVGRGGKVVVSQDTIRKAERMDGKCVLITNDDTLSVEDAATGYKNLLVIERCFRTMKTAQIRMDPVYHWLPRRIEAHVKICTLALLLQRVAELAQKDEEHGVGVYQNDTWLKS